MRQPATGITQNLGNRNRKKDRTAVRFSSVLWIFSVHRTEPANTRKYTEAEKLEMQVLDARNRILGVEHPDTITAMANLAATYLSLEKYTEAEKLKIQVFNGRCKILGVEHPDTIRAKRVLASTYYKLGKYTEGEKLQIQAQEAQSRVSAEEHSHKVKTVPNVEDAQDTQVYNSRSAVHEEKTSDLVQVVLNPPVQAVVPDTIINHEKKGMSFGNCFFSSL
jgi:hypothetical protein